MFPVKLSCLILIGCIAFSVWTGLKEIQTGRRKSNQRNMERNIGNIYYFSPSFMSSYGVF